MTDAPLTGGAHASDARPDEAHPGLAERWASVQADVADGIARPAAGPTR
ncbi:hypothetical protein BC477_12515 [Clavibacter michiganensis subsp. michiganensis]|uniref:Uncharacterized protein n=1 Tax=Clavibacter michiganensis subsp. michiganensis TaxID=33013 RepID=A0A251XHV5_CLAMM|nr:hypothetical protein BC477_12515 [Clavibacter michiganensis subsp. michiganensis]OUE02620.1 hypothetical protein CMMCAS07_11420 [Clavibacter michiganensis subsp. michiganensis]